jgi:hypothetical protein
MTGIEERFAGNGDDESLIERQLFRRASVKRESRTCPTENCVANRTPLRFRWRSACRNVWARHSKQSWAIGSLFRQ